MFETQPRGFILGLWLCSSQSSDSADFQLSDEMSTENSLRQVRFFLNFFVGISKGDRTNFV